MVLDRRSCRLRSHSQEALTSSAQLLTEWTARTRSQPSQPLPVQSCAKAHENQGTTRHGEALVGRWPPAACEHCAVGGQRETGTCLDNAATPLM